jgi:hypothetical protein
MFSKIKGENEQQRIKSERELSFEKSLEKKKIWRPGANVMKLLR